MSEKDLSKTTRSNCILQLIIYEGFLILRWELWEDIWEYKAQDWSIGNCCISLCKTSLAAITLG